MPGAKKETMGNIELCQSCPRGNIDNAGLFMSAEGNGASNRWDPDRTG